VVRKDPQLLLRSLALAREHDLDEAVGRALINLCAGYAAQRRVDLLHVFDDGIEDCDRRGLELWRRYVATSRAELHVALGRWDDAVDGVADVLTLASDDGLILTLAWCVTTTVRLRRGDPGAREALAVAESLVARQTLPDWLLPVRLVAAEQAWLDGASPEQMRALTDDVLDACREIKDDWGVDGLLRRRRLAGITNEATGSRTRLSAPDVEHWCRVGCGSKPRWTCSNSTSPWRPSRCCS